MEPANYQTWLSLTGICTTLNISHTHAMFLAKKGFLCYIPGRKGAEWKDARFLDPTPEYASRLKMGEALYGRLHPIPIDLELAGMLTIREVAVIMGWKLGYARKYSYEKKLPSVKAGKYDLYSMATVRKLLWKRQDRRLISKQKGPFLLSELIEFFKKSTATAEQEVPTDTQFAEDELLQRKLTRMAKLNSPEREIAIKQFMDKVALAKLLCAAGGTPKP